jgi:hypothetical protein
MACLLGFVAFAVDVGTLTHAKREMQTAADAGAVAGAAEFAYGGKPAATTAADAATALNGFTNGSNGITVTVDTPPSYGAYVGVSNYVEVIVSQSQPTFFMKMFSQSSKTVGARAVAYNGAATSNCIYVLDPTASPAMELKGSFTVTAPSCGVIVDSNATSGSAALHFTGGGGTLTAGYIGVVGNDGGQTGDSTPAPVTGIAAVSDPLGAVTPPDPLTLTCTAGGTLTGTIGPAVAGGIVCYSGNVTLQNVTLNAGTYVFTGSTVTLKGNVTSGTGGTTLDINNGTLQEGTGTTLALVAPTPTTCSACAYNGIAIMQPASNTGTMTMEFGNSTGSITGIIYMPTAKLFLHDSGGGSTGLSLTTDLIVGTLEDQTATLNLTSYSKSVNSSPLTRVALVE